MTLDQYLADGLSADCSAKLAKKIDTRPSILDKLKEFASSVPDFRRNGRGNLRHKLADVIMLIVFATACGCSTRAGIIAFGQRYLKRIQKIGILRNGVPSEPTLCRMDQGICDLGMADVMRLFIAAFHQDRLENAGALSEIISLDGRALRGTVQENGRCPDVVSAYSFGTGLVLATEACQEKSNEIKVVPPLLSKIDICGKIVTADAMAMQREIVELIRGMGGDFLIELKANQKSLRYGVEDKIKALTPLQTIVQGPELGHGRIETRTYRVYSGQDVAVDKEKWGASLTIIECESHTVEKSTGKETADRRLYATSLPASDPRLGAIARSHWSIESMHWCLDHNLKQDSIKRKRPRSARNLDTILRIVYSIFSIWKGLRKKKADKEKGMAQLMREVSMDYTKLIKLLNQK